MRQCVVVRALYSVIHKEKEKKVSAREPRSSRSNVVLQHSSRFDVRWCCAVPSRDLLSQRIRGRLWTVVEFLRVGKICQASTLSKLYFRLGVFLRTGKEEEFRSGNQEQEDIDGTGKVEN